MESMRRIRERNLAELAKVVNVEDALTLQYISRRLHTLDECACNQELTQRQATRLMHLEQQAEQIAQQYHLHAYHQSDPRGWSLYLVKSLAKADGDYSTQPAVCPH